MGTIGRQDQRDLRWARRLLRQQLEMPQLRDLVPQNSIRTGLAIPKL